MADRVSGNRSDKIFFFFHMTQYVHWEKLRATENAWRISNFRELEYQEYSKAKCDYLTIAHEILNAWKEKIKIDDSDFETSDMRKCYKFEDAIHLMQQEDINSIDGYKGEMLSNSKFI